MLIKYKGIYSPKETTQTISDFVTSKLEDKVYGRSGELEVLQAEVDAAGIAIAGLVQFCAKDLNSAQLRELLISMGIYIDEKDVFEVVTLKSFQETENKKKDSA